MARQGKDSLKGDDMTTAVDKIPRHGQLGVTACLLVEAMKEGKPGQTLTDEALTAFCGKDTSPGMVGYSSLVKAIHYVTQHFGIVWKRVPKAGCIKVLDAHETAEDVSSDMTCIRRKTRRTIRKAAATKLADLTQEERTQMLATSAQLGAIALMADSGTTKKLAARNVETTPDVKKLMELFQG